MYVCHCVRPSVSFVAVCCPLCIAEIFETEHVENFILKSLMLVSSLTYWPPTFYFLFNSLDSDSRFNILLNLEVDLPSCATASLA